MPKRDGFNQPHRPIKSSQMNKTPNVNSIETSPIKTKEEPAKRRGNKDTAEEYKGAR